MMPSSGTGLCDVPSSRTGHPVPELDNDPCTTLTPIAALVPILALVPEWGRSFCPHSCTGAMKTGISTTYVGNMVKNFSLVMHPGQMVQREEARLAFSYVYFIWTLFTYLG